MKTEDHSNPLMGQIYQQSRTTPLGLFLEPCQIVTNNLKAGLDRIRSRWMQVHLSSKKGIDLLLFFFHPLTIVWIRIHVNTFTWIFFTSNWDRGYRTKGVYGLQLRTKNSNHFALSPIESYTVSPLLFQTLLATHILKTHHICNSPLPSITWFSIQLFVHDSIYLNSLKGTEASAMCGCAI